MSEPENQVYSYHTFVLPFFWKMKGVTVDQEYGALKELFESNSFWKCTNLKDDSDILSKPDVEDFRSFLSFYKEYQYFFPYVRKVIYGYGDDICSNYLFEPSRNNGEYHIVKGNKHFVLNINAIRVKVVNTGIALFIMECENYGKDAAGNSQTDIGSIKDINDYGRRITLPFIDKNFSITADKLGVSIPGVGEFIDDVKKFREDSWDAGIDGAESIFLNHTCEFIKQIMSYGSRCRFISRPAKRDKEVQICPALDDRMYVAFAFCDKHNTAKLVKGIDGNGNNVIITDGDLVSDDEINKSIYETAYVDRDGDCTCPEKKLRMELIDKALYKRWMPGGTLYTISEMAFGMITTGWIEHLYESFLTMYLHMVYLVIIQRASIIKFNRETADISRHFAAEGRKLRRGDIRRIMNLQERHAAFCGQLFFSEVSQEQQGVEMYDMFKETFRFEKENEKLGSDLTRLYEITDTDLNIAVNTSVSILTWVSIILSAGAMFYNIFFASDVVIQEEKSFSLQAGLATWMLLLCMFLLSVSTFVIFNKNNRRR